MSEATPRILIVDDREENRYVLCRVLRQAGYDCVEIDNGADALKAALTLPDLMILDVRLPDFSGYEVCQSIKHDPRTAQISILQISASFVSSEDRARALEAGADGYLTHPIDAVVLVATVKALLRLRTAENVARKSAEQWQATFDALTEGLALVDSEGRLVRWNGAFAEICGPQSNPSHHEDAAVLLERVLGASEFLRLNGTERFQSEYSIHQRTVQLTVNPVDPENPDAGKILVLSDVTDRKLAEYALRTAEKIAATGKLAHAIAHEINNPLEALTNLLYLAGTSNSLENIHDLLAHASSEVERIARITKQTLSFQRDTQHPLVLDVGELVSEVVAVYQKSATARRVRVVCHRRPTLAIHGFPGQLSQIFSNLVRNAAEAAPQGTEVVVRVRSICRHGREGTRVTIHDRGRGIPSEVRTQMFDPFFTTKELKGSGLGLWVSKNLIMKHQGTIRFRTSTREGASGTTFEVFLPVGGLSSLNLANQ
ncbi:MAG TPA: ATP-binding protein [Terracidiphilus sp.]|jgi:signal transduction histidine kinase